VDAVLENSDAVVKAFGYTGLLFVISGLASLLVGTVLAALRVGPVAVLRRAVAVYVTLIRNTPLLVVLLFFRIAGPKVGLRFDFIDVQVAGFNLNNIFTACVVGLTVYTSTFVCEALRSGVNAVPLGQAEAARAIGLTFGGAMREVILPQAFRASLPPLTSVQIALLKNTTVAGAVGVFEAFARMRSLTNDYTTQTVMIFVVFAIIFVVLVELISALSYAIERRWKVAR
jgi:glutamate transport system permease protein